MPSSSSVGTLWLWPAKEMLPLPRQYAVAAFLIFITQPFVTSLKQCHDQGISKCSSFLRVALISFSTMSYWSSGNIAHNWSVYYTSFLWHLVVKRRTTMLSGGPGRSLRKHQCHMSVWHSWSLYGECLLFLFPVAVGSAISALVDSI